MAEVALDANVVVGFLDASDALHERATSLLRRIEARGTMSSCWTCAWAKPSRCCADDRGKGGGEPAPRVRRKRPRIFALRSSAFDSGPWMATSSG